MTDTLLKPSADADRKQAQRFASWLSAEGVDFESDPAAERYRFVIGLLQDAIRLKQPPQRVPVCLSPGHFPLEYAGCTFYDAMYDPLALGQALEKYHSDFDPDTFSGSFIGSGAILDLLDARLYQWPGHGVSRAHEYQFVEQEVMRAEEYDELIADPSGFHLRRFLPRVCGALKPLEKMPDLLNLRHMSSMAAGVHPFHLPEMRGMLQTLAQAGAQAERWTAAGRAVSRRITGRGFPALAGGIAEAPYDIIGDSLRGTRGISLDMKRCPDKLLAACRVYVPSQIRRAVAAADTSGNPLIFMPLHKGAHSFMSGAQFETFYWPTLRQVIIGLINQGLVPVLFAESDYDSRLEIISDLPHGKTVWWFEKVDMARAKSTVGRVACLAGNISNIMFRAGTPDDIRQCCRQLIDTAGRRGGFILSTAAGLQGARPENVKTAIDFSRSYGVYT